LGDLGSLIYGRQAGDELDLMALIGGGEELAAIQWEKSMWLGENVDEKKLFRTHVRKGGYALNCSRVNLRTGSRTSRHTQLLGGNLCYVYLQVSHKPGIIGKK
jgi:hypothetical protein